MKVRINSLLPIDIPKSLKDLDISMGFSYYEGADGENGNFTIQSYTILKKFLGFKNIDLTNEDLKFIVNIGDVVQYTLENFKNNNISHNLQDNLSLQINTQRGDGYLNKIVNNPFRKINNSSKLAQVHHLFNGHKIMLGVNFIHDKKNNFLPYIKDSLDNDTFMQFIYFHELAHVIEHEYSPNLNKIAYNIRMSEEEQDVMSKKVPLSISKTRKIFESIVKSMDSEQLLDPNHSMIHNSNILWREIYADTMGLLLHQNYCLERNKPTDIKKITDIVIRSREDELLGKNTKKSISLMQNYTGHYTSIGLSTLKELLPSIEKQNLDLDKINEIANYCANQGVHKYLYTLIESHPLTIEGLVWLYNKTATSNEKITINELKAQIISEIDGSWTENFQNNKEALKTSNVTSEQYSYYISMIGLIPDKFKDLIENHSNHNNCTINKNNFINQISKVREDINQKPSYSFIRKSN